MPDFVTQVCVGANMTRFHLKVVAHKNWFDGIVDPSETPLASVRSAIQIG